MAPSDSSVITAFMVRLPSSDSQAYFMQERY